tara:strand:+ start:479 stop:622 length:144 start_codon:yes stop_codon:yes gene_type:complete
VSDERSRGFATRVIHAGEDPGASAIRIYQAATASGMAAITQVLMSLL